VITNTILIAVGISDVATLDCKGQYRGDAIAEGYSTVSR